MLTPARLLENNLDRVVDSVLRTLSAGATPGMAPGPTLIPAECDGTAAEAQVRETIADLCGHVAFALRSLEPHPHGVASYRAPGAPSGTAPSLDVRR